MHDKMEAHYNENFYQDKEDKRKKWEDKLNKSEDDSTMEQFKKEFCIKKGMQNYQVCFWFKFIADHYRYMIEFDE